MSASAVMMGAAALAQIAAQYNTNMTNRKIAKDNIGMQLAYNADQVAVAQMNNQTQIDLANTAHQREVNDLRDAGLNPILSATGGNGAAMPSLSGPNGTQAPQDAYQAENPLKELGVSAREIGRYLSESYQAQVEQARQAAESYRLDNALQKENLKTAKIAGALERTELGARNAAYFKLRQPFYDDNGNEIVRVSDDGSVVLNEDYIDDLVSAIKADLHNRKWSDVREWLHSITGAAAAAGSAAASSVGAARGAKMLRK